MSKITQNWLHWHEKWEEEKRNKEFFQKELEKANKRIIKLKEKKYENKRKKIE